MSMQASVKVILLGATGMVGQGVLRECLLEPRITRVLLVTRRASGILHEKVEEIVLPDLSDADALSALVPRFEGAGACFFCIGVSSAGMSGTEYTSATFDLTMGIARAVSRADPGMAFVYVSGAGTDSSEKGRSMWARVKGRTENALLAMFPHAVMFRPGYIQPMDGIRSKTPLYRVSYAVARPFYPLLRRAFPNVMTTTRDMGKAMIEVALHGSHKRILEARDIVALAAAARSADIT